MISIFMQMFLRMSPVSFMLIETFYKVWIQHHKIFQFITADFSFDKFLVNLVLEKQNPDINIDIKFNVKN